MMWGLFTPARSSSADAIDQITMSIGELILRFNLKWKPMSLERMDLGQQSAALMCMWSCFVEGRFRGDAWTASAFARFECVARGKWLDRGRQSILPNRLRASIPGWAGHPVSVQNDKRIEFRLTPAGFDLRNILTSTPRAKWPLAISSAYNEYPGWVAIRLLRVSDKPSSTRTQGAGRLFEILTTGFSRVVGSIDTLRDAMLAGGSARENAGTSTATTHVESAAPASHSEDFTSVNWFGTRHTFSKGLQAESVRALWAAWQNGNHSLSQATIAEKIGTSADDFQLSKVFRRRRSDGPGYEQHPAWGTMIQREEKGTYSLVPCDPARTPQES